MNKILQVIAFIFISVSFTGCGDFNNFKLMPEEESPLLSLFDEKKDSKTDAENTVNDNNLKSNDNETEKNKIDNVKSTEILDSKKNVEPENSQPFSPVNYNIPVRNDEMDKLIKLARDCQWIEKDVKKAVIILKNCGIDVANIKDIREPLNYGDYTIYLKPNDAIIREEIYLKLTGAGTREIEKVYVSPDKSVNVDLYVKEGNTEKILRSCDKLFFTLSVYKKIEDNVKNFINSKGGKYTSHCEYSYYKMDSLPIDRRYDAVTKNVYYEIESKSSYLDVQIPSEIYGVGFEDAILYGKFDADGNVISMDIEKKS